MNNHYRELDTPASINERSYQIFGEEKFLKENPLSTAILKNTGIDIEVLNIYNTPEPFFLFQYGRLYLFDYYFGKQGYMVYAEKSIERR